MSNGTGVEKWAKHPSYDHIEVSSLGRIRSLPFVDPRGWRRKGGIRTVKPRSDGYVEVDISGKPRKVHQLVTETFLGPLPEGMEVLHMDACRSNNALANLQYGTRSQNQLQRVADGNHYLAQKTHCKRGHLLIDPNLRPSGKVQGKRQCRACHLAESWVRKHPDSNMQDASDYYYGGTLTT